MGFVRPSHATAGTSTRSRPAAAAPAMAATGQPRAPLRRGPGSNRRGQRRTSRIHSTRQQRSPPMSALDAALRLIDDVAADGALAATPTVALTPVDPEDAGEP